MVLDKCLSTSPLKNTGEKQKPAGWTAKKRVGRERERDGVQGWLGLQFLFQGKGYVKVWGFRSKGSGKGFSRK